MSNYNFRGNHFYGWKLLKVKDNFNVGLTDNSKVILNTVATEMF